MVHSSTRSRRRLSAGVAATVFAAVGCADHGDHAGGASTTAEATSAPSTRWVTVTMTDNAFSPSSIEATAGEIVRFKFVNEGSVVHEALIGTEAEQADHERAMAGEMSGMDMGSGGDEHAAHHGALKVQPGETGISSKRFDRAGTVLIGCHQPGHYEAGMQATVEVR
jgi:uncharacterized cupredoxin-like copper-binding protein